MYIETLRGFLLNLDKVLEVGIDQDGTRIVAAVPDGHNVSNVPLYHSTDKVLVKNVFYSLKQSMKVITL